MVDIQKLIYGADITIKEAIKRIDQSGRKIIFIADHNDCLIGVVTDGDIRRWILKNGDLGETVSHIMNSSPIFVYEGNESTVYEKMKSNYIEAVPVVDKNAKIINVLFWNDNFDEVLCRHGKIDIPVIIMAGGEGSRLYPYTKILPKPLIPIGDTPIVERIINKFSSFGCKNFYMTINYKKNMIKAYFSDLHKDYKIDFVEEDKPLGTAGSLSLLREKLQETFFLSNCDILVDGNYSDMLKYHKENNNKVTLITSLKNYIIPYGVIEMSATSEVEKLIEKPEYNFLVNTGMYIMEPDTLIDIPEKAFFHITDLITSYVEKGEKIGIYPVSEKSWLDMGQFKEMQEMIEKLGV